MSGNLDDRRWSLALALPVVVGAGLRLWNLPAQVLVGDERWDVTAAVELPGGEVLTSLVFGASNVCPPLVAWIRLLIEAGAQPGEWMLRLPSVICGVAAVALLPWLVRRVVGDRAAWIFAGLLALSPFLVIYSRMVRVYMPLLLVATVSVLVYYRFREHRFRERGSWVLGGVYAASAAFAIYLHLLAVPFVLAPVLFGVLGRLRAREFAWREWAPVVGLGFATALAVLVFIGPAWESLWYLLSAKGGEGAPTLAAASGAAMRLAGTTSGVVACAFYLAAGRGLFVLARTRPDFAALTGFVAAAGVTSVAILAPIGADGPVLLSRYVLPVLPWLLLWAAVGLGEPLASKGAPLQIAATVLFGVLLVWRGPLGAADFYRSSFAHRVIHEAWRLEDRPSPGLESEHFYAALGDPASAGAVVEIPYHVVLFTETAAAHQRIHGQPVRVSANLDVWWQDPRLGFEVHLRPEPEALLASDARHVVVHLRASQEEFAVLGRDPEYPKKTQRAANFSQNVDFTSQRLAETLESSWGAPAYRDAWIVAWDLDRVRAGR